MNSPGEVGPAVGDPEGQARDTQSPTGQGYEVLGVIDGFGGLIGRAGVGQIVLAEAELPPQPPEQRLVEEENLSERDQVPPPDVAALDVGPLVSQPVAKGVAPLT